MFDAHRLDSAVSGRLGPGAIALRWFFEPMGQVSEAGRAFLFGQLLRAPFAAIMGSLCAIIVAAVALLRSGDAVYGLFVALELALIVGRLVDWRRREARLRADRGHVPAIDGSALVTLLWCMLQGAMTFTIMAGDDPVLRVLSAMLVMALVGPLCARNYPAPRFAMLLVLLCDLPFVAGAVASGEPWLAVIVPLTPPFLLGAMQIIVTFHRAMLVTLAAEARNLHLAQHDSLTGLLNRQGMDQALGRIRPDIGRKMALISIDLDGFKLVNDTYGHGAGDVLLIQVGERIRRELRPEDLVARMGGDEFMAIVRDMSPDEVGPLADRLIAASSTRPYQLGGDVVVRVGASIGFACLPEDAASTVELRLRADQALYAAKGAGRGVGRRYGTADATQPRARRATQ